MVAKAWNSDRIQIQTHPVRVVDALVNGRRLKFELVKIHHLGNVTVQQGNDTSEINATFSDVSLTVRVQNGMIRVMMAISPKYKNQTKGILGVWNGNVEDDFTARNGRVLPPDASPFEVHEDFGQTCKEPFSFFFFFK